MKTYYNPFSSEIYYDNESKVSNHDELKDFLIDLYNQSPTKEGNFYGTGLTTYFFNDFTSHLDTLPIFKELSEMILLKATEYVNNRILELNKLGINLEKPKELEIVNLWFNVNPYGGYQGKHHHAMNLLGGTYYINTPEDSGKIIFSNPNPFSYLKNQEPVINHLTSSDFRFNPEPGDLLIWPGWMDHEITSNDNVNDNRITVSFGLNWKKDV